MNNSTPSQPWIAVVDFGSQYTHLITRMLRELGAYAEIVSANHAWAKNDEPAGIVLSGSPHSIHGSDAPQLNRDLLQFGVPILGICYGFQLLMHTLGGEVRAATSTGGGEYGRSKLVTHNCGLMGNLSPSGSSGDAHVWMSHGDEVTRVPAGWEITAVTESGAIAAAEHSGREIVGLQFHPEVHHSACGKQLFDSWLATCAIDRTWTPNSVHQHLLDFIREQAGERSVMSFVSGGVDSTVATALVVEALGSDRVHPVHVNNGLLRLGESDFVCEALGHAGIPVLRVDAAARFHDALRGETDPERKRYAIGDTFIEIQEEVAKELSLEAGSLLCQGTLYPDLVESGLGIGTEAATMISHHNVGTPLVRAKREAGLLLEPLAQLYKDEVRQLGSDLGIDQALLDRQPFPGPGLALRILGEVTFERCELLRRVDAVLQSELSQRGITDTDLWQAFAVLTGARAVGVHGDARSYGEVVAIRAMTSRDGMTADCFRFEWDDLMHISTRITEECREVSKVVYDISTKPPSNVEWE